VSEVETLSRSVSKLRIKLAEHRQLQPSEIDAEMRAQDEEEGRLKVALASSEAEHANLSQTLGHLLTGLHTALGYHRCGA
jgi:hypothetical protein